MQERNGKGKGERKRRRKGGRKGEKLQERDEKGKSVSQEMAEVTMEKVSTALIGNGEGKRG